MFSQNSYRKNLTMGWLIGILVFLIILFTYFSPIAIVRSGYVGVPVMFGKVLDYSYPNGFHLVNPLIDVVQIPVSIQRVPLQTEAASSDLQSVIVQATANYRIQTSDVSKLYFDFQRRYEIELIVPAVLEAIKSSSAKLNAEKLITDRAEFRRSILATANEKLSRYGIALEEISIENIEFSPSFNEAIEKKVTAEQDALTARNQLEKVKFEAQQTIEKAQAEAEAVRVKAQSIAASPQIVELEAIQKWNGELPQYVGSGSIPFINIR